MKNIFAIIFILATQNLLASLSPKIKITGVVKSFDEKNVVLQQKDHKFEIARKYFAKKIKVGETVTIEVNRSEMFKKIVRR